MPKLLSAGFTIETEIDGERILREIERFARNCYKSEEKIGDFEQTKAFVNRLLHTNHHEGICDHHQISVRLVIDRGVSHELVRHRIAAYLQESTRYCDYGKAGEIKVIDIGPHFRDPRSFDRWWRHMIASEEAYNDLRSYGEPPELARSVLPNSLKTEVIATLNLRSWRNFFRLRTSPKAHPQMREVAVPLLWAFKRDIPVIFDDIQSAAAGGRA